MPQACPGCGREYRRADVECPCGYAERAVRFATRPSAPPEDWLARKRADRLVREQLERLREIEKERVRAEHRKLDELIAKQIAAAKPAKPAEPESVSSPQPKSVSPARKSVSPPKPKPLETLVDRWQRRTPSLSEVRRSQKRVALIHNLGAESRFYEQRTQAASRWFGKLLERVAPSEETTGDWPEPLEMGRTLGVHHYGGKPFPA